MSLFTVHVNGKNHVVDSPSKSTASAWGQSQAEVKVTPSSAADLEGVDLKTVPVLLPRGKVKGADTPADGAAGEPAAE